MEVRSIAIIDYHLHLRADTQAIKALFWGLDRLDGFNGIPAGELSIALLDAERMSQVHCDFLNDLAQTDVITFPGEPSMDFAGEICLGVDCIAAFAKTHAIPLAEELNRCLIHGWLHLAGYRDDAAPARLAMRQAEDDCLRRLSEQAVLPEYDWTRSCKIKG